MKVAVIGVGNMGGAYVDALLNKKLVSTNDLILFDASIEKVNELKAQGLTAYDEIGEVLLKADVIVLAVKPQFFAQMAEVAQPFIKKSAVLVSIMAGVRSELIASLLNGSAIVRAMPNTPCMLNKGITGVFVSEEAQQSPYISEVMQMLASTGDVVEVGQEKDIDTVTAISGSGPAYFYYFIQQMTQAGVAMGLTEEVAKKLANQTMNGAHHMINAQHEKDIDELIAAVTSKGGTTEAALKMMRDNGVGVGIQKGLNRAAKRAEELSDMIAEEVK